MAYVTPDIEHVVLTPETDIVAASAQPLRTALCETLQSGQKHIVVDLQHVAMVDSVGLGVFIATHNSLQARGGHLTLTNASSDMQRLFQLMRLDQHFTVVAR